MRLVLFLIKLLMVVIIVCCVISYINYLKTGRFWVPQISVPEFSMDLPSFKKAPEMKSLEAPTETIYKWRVRGEWVYGDNPPDNVNALLISEEN